MRGPPKSSDWSSRVRFSGSSSGDAHAAWYRAIAEHYDAIANPTWDRRTDEFLASLLRRHGPIVDVLDVACGTFRLDLNLVRQGYRVYGRDLSPDMIRVARENLARAKLRADVSEADMRTLAVGLQFDAILCLGTAFNYLVDPADVRRALKGFSRHLRRGGLLVLDLTNFDAWINDPKNARVDWDFRGKDGTRLAIYGFNDQSPGKVVHLARFLTVVQRGPDIDVRFDEAPLKVWSKETIARALRTYAFRPVEWWGDLAPGVPYRPKKSERLVAVAKRL